MKRSYDKYVEELKPLFKKYDIDKVWVFGSRARGDHRVDSDLDLAYERKNKYSMFNELSTMKLVNELTNTLFDIEIHVTNIDNILKGDSYFKRSAKKDLILVYTKEDEKIYGQKRSKCKSEKMIGELNENNSD